jgi:hypothetical protein
MDLLSAINNYLHRFVKEDKQLTSYSFTGIVYEFFKKKESIRDFFYSTCFVRCVILDVIATKIAQIRTTAIVIVPPTITSS